MSPLLLLGLVGLGVLMLLGAGIALLSGGNRQVEQRMEQFVGSSTVLTPEDVTTAQRNDVADRLDEALADRGLFSGIKARIAMADVRLRVSEYVALQLVFAVVGVVVAAILFGPGPVMLLIGAIIGLFVPRIYVSTMATRRLHTFEGQLSDTLNLWVNALRSGYSVLQGMEAIATELPPPVSKEFERVVQEVRLGLSLNQALGNMLRRVPSEDLDLVVTAVNIQREVGGNLTEILDTISYTIRERVRIKGEIRTLTSQGRLTGIIISLLPIGLGLVLYLINPEYVGQLIVRDDPFLFGIPCGWIVIGFGLLLMFFGVLAIRKIVDIEV